MTERTDQQRDQGKVDLNRASREELVRIKGIGERRVDAILERRRAHKFKSVDSLDRLPQFQDMEAEEREAIKAQLKV